MATKLYDVCVKTGTYIQNNEQKNRYENIGSVMQNDDGGQFLLLKTTFNPAGVPNPENRDTVLCSLFEQRNQNQAPQDQYGQAQIQQPAQQALKQPYGQPQQPYNQQRG